MYCTHCGARVEQTDAFCASCGIAASQTSRPPALESATPEPVRSTANQENVSAADNRRITFAVVGGLVGAMLGYVFRPSVFLVGQLPFGTVITRGGNLSGMDQLLVPAAQSSFNLLIAGTVVGAIVGVVIAMFVGPSPASVRPPAAERSRVASEDEPA